MQSEPQEATSNQPPNLQTDSSSTTAQHGHSNFDSHSEDLLLFESDGRSGSEWSRSASAETSPSRLDDTGVEDAETASTRSRDFFESGGDDSEYVQDGLKQLGRRAGIRKRHFPFEEFPEG